MGRKRLKIGDTVWLHCGGRTYTVMAGAQATTSTSQKRGQIDNSLRSPMPGMVLVMKCKEGDTIKKGMTLCVLEAMKMEYTMSAPYDGRVAQVYKNTGERVALGEKILEVQHGG